MHVPFFVNIKWPENWNICYYTLIRLDMETRRPLHHGERWLVHCAQSQECSPWPCLFQSLCQTLVTSTIWIRRREIQTTLTQFLSRLKNESQNPPRIRFPQDKPAGYSRQTTTWMLRSNRQRDWPRALQTTREIIFYLTLFGAVSFLFIDCKKNVRFLQIQKHTFCHELCFLQDINEF